MASGRVNEAGPSIALRDFLAAEGQLSVEQRVLVARQALLILEQNYAHLPLKAARYAVNPLQRLRLLIARLGRGGPPEPEWRFHAEMLDIFGTVRDLHTRYVLPEPFASAVAFLPFLLKEFVEGDERHFVVARSNEGPAGALPTGVEVRTWNGVPIERALDLFGNRLPGANPAARHARALTTLTVRSLGFTGPPDEEFVLIEYLDSDGSRQEAREVWQVTLPEEEEVLEDVVPVEQRFELELDVEAARVAWLRTHLFAPRVLDLMAGDEDAVAVSGGIPVTRELATSFEAGLVPGASGGQDVGHIRIRTFAPRPPAPSAPPPSIPAFVNEFIRLLGLMPPHGVVIDIRGNGGGSPVAAEMCLQALTARQVESQPLQFICSPLNLSICRQSGASGGEDLAPWVPSMEQAVESGAVFSAGVPRAAPELLAAVPQAYFGPVVLLTDARVYSAADRFAAGFQDNEIGLVLGVDGNTGAGGANVWKHADLQRAMSTAPESPYHPLPEGTDITVAIRRTLRVGRSTGMPVEDFGVEPDEVHLMTRNDVVRQGVDLMAHAGRLLEQQGPERRVDVALEESTDGLTARLDVKNIDRADLYTDGRPRESVELTGATASVGIPLPTPAAEVRVEGFASDRPVAVRRFRRRPDGQLGVVSTFVL